MSSKNPIGLRKALRPIGPVVIAGSLLLPTAACSGEAGNSGPEPAAIDLPAQPDPGIRDAVHGLFNGMSVQAAAEQELILQCMRKKGFDYTKLVVGTKDFNPGLSAPAYGQSVADAKANGYPERDDSDGGEQTRPELAGLGEAERNQWYEAFWGPDSGPEVRVTLPNGAVVTQRSTGCKADALRTLYGSIEEQLKLVTWAGNLPIIAMQRASSDPTLDALNKNWKTCMSSKSWTGFASPDEARVGAAELDGDKAAALAVADAECESQVDYASQRRRLEDRYLTAAIHADEGFVAAIAELNDRALAKAKQVLSGKTA